MTNTLMNKIAAYARDPERVAEDAEPPKDVAIPNRQQRRASLSNTKMTAEQRAQRDRMKADFDAQLKRARKADHMRKAQPHDLGLTPAGRQGSPGCHYESGHIPNQEAADKLLGADYAKLEARALAHMIGPPPPAGADRRAKRAYKKKLDKALNFLLNREEQGEHYAKTEDAQQREQEHPDPSQQGGGGDQPTG